MPCLVEMPRDALEYLVKCVPEEDHLPMALVCKLLSVMCIDLNTNRGLRPRKWFTSATSTLARAEWAVVCMGAKATFKWCKAVDQDGEVYRYLVTQLDDDDHIQLLLYRMNRLGFNEKDEKQLMHLLARKHNLHAIHKSSILQVRCPSCRTRHECLRENFVQETMSATCGHCSLVFNVQKPDNQQHL